MGLWLVMCAPVLFRGGLVIFWDGYRTSRTYSTFWDGYAPYISRFTDYTVTCRGAIHCSLHRHPVHGLLLRVGAQLAAQLLPQLVTQCLPQLNLALFRAHLRQGAQALFKSRLWS